jgi:predicted HicB family RNase H-like nuclease
VRNVRYDSRAMPRTARDEDVVKPNPRIPRPLYERLQRIAARERRSLNEQIVKALEEHAQREEQKK